MARAKQIINGMTREISVGEMYKGRVVTIKEFGCFVEVLPGKDGMVHISGLTDFRVNRVEDVVKQGDLIWVKYIGVDEKGRVKLSRKAAMKERDEATGNGAPAAPAGTNQNAARIQILRLTTSQKGRLSGRPFFVSAKSIPSPSIGNHPAKKKVEAIAPSANRLH